MPSQTSIPPTGSEEVLSGSESLDELAEALAHPGRRRLLAHLHGADEVSIGSLADLEGVTDTTDERAASRRLRGIHLPKLVAADLIECDYRRGSVVPTTTLDCLIAPVGACREATEAPEGAGGAPSQ